MKMYLNKHHCRFTAILYLDIIHQLHDAIDIIVATQCISLIQIIFKQRRQDHHGSASVGTQPPQHLKL